MILRLQKEKEAVLRQAATEREQALAAQRAEYKELQDAARIGRERLLADMDSAATIAAANAQRLFACATNEKKAGDLRVRVERERHMLERERETLRLQFVIFYLNYLQTIVHMYICVAKISTHCALLIRFTGSSRPATI